MRQYQLMMILLFLSLFSVPIARYSQARYAAQPVAKYNTATYA